VNEIVKRIQFVYFDAGGGHRAAATALKTVIEQQQRPWEITLVNLQELLRPMDIFRKVTRIDLQDLYNLMLARGWTLGSAQWLRLVHAIIRLRHSAIVPLLERHWNETKPDLVVSLVPNFNRAMFESVSKSSPRTPYLTVMTDFADYPPHFWIEKQPQFLICGTEKAAEQARTLGHGNGRLFEVSGMILRPHFYAPLQIDRAAERRKLGLDPERPTGLVLFGGQGSDTMTEIARRLDDIQLIFICGKNAKLASQLRAMPASAPRFIEGFTSEIPYYMNLSDFFIGKPGPGSISEAIAMKLPVIVEKNAFTLPQERYNTEWVEQRGVGVVLPNFRGIRDAVQKLLGSLDDYRARVASIENRAVFEIPEIMERILSA
jgi:1,2-diacylglycerol 3-beta-galactosyltransferase